MATYIQIGSTVTVGAGGAASIDFTSIPSTYTDLQILISGRQSNAAITGALQLSFNTSTANFTYRSLQGAGSGTPSSGNGSSNYFGQTPGATATASTFGNASVYIPNYAGSNYKSVSVETVDETNGTTTFAQMNANLWSITTAINAVSVIAGAANWVQYTTATLYGISKS